MRKLLLFLLSLIAFQAAFTFTFFPVHELPLQKPLLHIDYALHYYQTLQTLDFMKAGRVWGYDPFFMAGYPTGGIYLANNFGASLVIGLLSYVLPVAVAIKVFVFFLLVLLPVVIFLSCRNFGFEVRESCLAGLILIQVLNVLWYYRWLIGGGLYSFVFAVIFAFWAFSCFYRYLQSPNGWAWAGYTLLGAYALSLHPLAAPWLALLIVVYCLFDYRRVATTAFAWLMLGSALIILLNVYWIWPCLQLQPYYGTPHHVHVTAFGWETLLEHLRDPGNIVFHLFLAGALISPFFFQRTDSPRQLFWVVWLAFLGVYVMAYFAGGPLAHLEPARFLIAAAFLIPVLLLYAFRACPEPAKRSILLSAYALLAVQIFFCSDVIPGLSYRQVARSDFSRDILREGAGGFVENVMQYTDSSARVLMEDNEDLTAYWGSHFLSVLPVLTGREFIGGPYHWLKLQHHFASFSDGRIFSKSIETIPIKRFMAYMDLYNVKWAVVHSPMAKDYFAAHPRHFRHLTTGYAMRRTNGKDEWFKHFEFYEVRRRASFFLEGSGHIEAKWDELTLADLSASEIVIKYHYLETLTTVPPVPLEETVSLDDPVGFIRIDNSAGHDTIRIFHDKPL